MNILYASDDKFVPIMGVSITSLFESNKDMDEINVYVLGMDISKENEQKLHDLAKHYGRKIILIDASEVDAYLNDVGAKEWGGGRAAWYRCFLGRLLPDDIERILYIDCDTIIVDSLRGLTQMKFGAGKAIAMVVATWNGGMLTKCLGLSENDPYYQSGVMLFDMIRWREMHCEDKLLAIIDKYSKDLPIVDQDAINCALHSLIQTLPIKYNLVTFNVNKESGIYEELDVEMQKSVNEAMIEPVIIHYASPSMYRPWHEDCEGAYMEEWRNYKDVSPWKDEPLWKGDSIKIHRKNSRLKDFCRRVLRVINPKLEEALWKSLAKSSDCTFCTRNMPCKVKNGYVTKDIN